MNRNIDLTLNRDFREENNSISRPRSIFKKENDKFKSIYNSINSTINTTTNIMTSNNWNSTGWTNLSLNSTTNSIIDYNDKVCDCCGKDITRIPWHKDSYGCLCKRCFERLEKNHSIKIPWND